jgi:uncharacterized caspase-like protein
MKSILYGIALLLTIDAHAGTRKALLIGINDYTHPARKPSLDRNWRDLGGPTNDVAAMRAILIGRYGFDARDVIALTNMQATRNAILEAIDRQLVASASKGDVVVFYFAGHGSQVRNSRSDERDGMDESLVPADSLAGAADIRDKELRPRFNAILDRGARLTVILDKCHSGSGARGAGRVRGIDADPRDVADRRAWGPRPEDRGALVLAATQDSDPAWETIDASGTIRGTFTWALLRAMRDAAANESAAETFLRARARLRAEMPLQEPVIAGTSAARHVPLFGTGGTRATSGPVIAVERTRADGTVVVHGGRIHGLAVGTELRDAATRLAITALIGVARSEARVVTGPAPKAGALLDVAHPLRRFELASPEPSPFRLAIRHARTREVAKDVLFGGERYELAITQRAKLTEARYVYAFVVDSAGRSTLLYPLHGSVENRFEAITAEQVIASFDVTEPYGTDTFFLLTTDEALSDPWVLQSDDLGSRSGAMPETWSIERVVLRSVPALTKWTPSRPRFHQALPHENPARGSRFVPLRADGAGGVRR